MDKNRLVLFLYENFNNSKEFEFHLAVKKVIDACWKLKNRNISFAKQLNTFKNNITQVNRHPYSLHCVADIAGTGNTLGSRYILDKHNVYYSPVLYNNATILKYVRLHSTCSVCFAD